MAAIVPEPTSSAAAAQSEPRWSVPARQHFVFDDFDDGIVMFDAAVGATHLLNVTAAETLLLVQQSPGLATSAIHRRLLQKLEVSEATLPLAAVEELAWRMEDLGLITASRS